MKGGQESSASHQGVKDNALGTHFDPALSSVVVCQCVSTAGRGLREGGTRMGT